MLGTATRRTTKRALARFAMWAVVFVIAGSALGVIRSDSEAVTSNGTPACDRTDRIADVRIMHGVMVSTDRPVDPSAVVRRSLAALYPGLAAAAMQPLESGSQAMRYAVRSEGRTIAVAELRVAEKNWSLYRIVACNSALVRAREEIR